MTRRPQLMRAKRLLFKSSFLFGLLFFVSGCAVRGSTISKESVVDLSPSPSMKAKKIYPLEQIHRWSMQPYAQFGKFYTPQVVPIGEKFEGLSSWYGPDFHGNKTSSGEVYDMHDLTAAHKTLPMNTIVKVRDKKSQKEVVVRINDRGPFVGERIIDLSFEAGKKIGLDKVGIMAVELEVLGYDEFISALLTKEASVLKEEKENKNFFVQIGSFKNERSAQKIRENAVLRYQNKDIKIKSAKIQEDIVYKVFVAGFKDETQAREFIRENGIDGAFVAIEN